MKRAMSGQLPLLGAIKKLMDEVMQPPSFDSGGDTGERLAHEAEVLAATRKIALFSAGVASQRFMTALQDQQEVMADLADMIAQVYALESAWLRARKLLSADKLGSGDKLGSARKGAAAEAAAAMTGMLAEGTLALAEQAGERVLAACGEGDMLRTQLAILRRLAKSTPADVVGLSRAVAQHCISAEKYPL